MPIKIRANQKGLTERLRLIYIHTLSQSCSTLCSLMDCSPPGSSPQNFPGKNTRAGCHFLLQGICQPRAQTDISCTDRQILYHECHLERPFLRVGKYYFFKLSQLIYNIVLASAIQRGDLVCIFFQVIFHYRLLWHFLKNIIQVRKVHLE